MVFCGALCLFLLLLFVLRGGMEGGEMGERWGSHSVPEVSQGEWRGCGGRGGGAVEGWGFGGAGGRGLQIAFLMNKGINNHNITNIFKKSVSFNLKNHIKQFQLNMYVCVCVCVCACVCV